MHYYFAPMEGITTALYRRIHHHFFPGICQYYTPFLAPARAHVFSQRELQEILPQYQVGIPLVPQLLTKSSEDFIWAAQELAAMGYREVNLNLGCPSGTVVAKGRGSGMLADLESLARFLDRIFGSLPDIRISIKTRLGLTDEEEFPRLLELYNQYPIWELTVHPRVCKDFYRNPIREQAFAYAVKQSQNPLCYNGDLRTEADCDWLQKQYPSVSAAMLGRGLVADPGLVSRLQGDAAVERSRLKEFHDALYDGYCKQYQNPGNALMRMKELWSYMTRQFPNPEQNWKRLRKCTRPGQYEAVVQGLFASLQAGV